MIRIRYIVLAMGFLFGFNPSWAQLSPGDLTDAHQHLEGLGNCTQCHTIGDAVTDKKCLACHEDIQNLLDQKRGYHHSTEVRSKTCVDCHSEHHGRKFEMSRFDQEKFDHDLTGYPLEGAHADVQECKDCHKAEYITDLEIRKRENTFLGLQEACVSCHDDYHQETLTDDCISCHSSDDETCVHVKKFCSDGLVELAKISVRHQGNSIHDSWCSSYKKLTEGITSVVERYHHPRVNWSSAYPTPDIDVRPYTPLLESLDDALKVLNT